MTEPITLRFCLEIANISEQNIGITLPVLVCQSISRWRTAKVDVNTQFADRLYLFIKLYLNDKTVNFNEKPNELFETALN